MSGPESGLDCLMCATFARERTAAAVVPGPDADAMI